MAYEVAWQKFSEDADLKALLLSTGVQVIAEASPRDRVWGIGVSGGDERARDPSQWLGRNIHGRALMQVREYLRGEPCRCFWPTHDGSGTHDEVARIGSFTNVKVVTFYSHKPERPFREFSNFYADAPPFKFLLPLYARHAETSDVVWCECSEKAIMLVKASMMG